MQQGHLQEFLNRTGNLLIHLLDKCNLQCQHCYLKASARGEKILPIDLVLNTLEEAHALGIRSLQLSGGEPMLYPGIRKVLFAAAGKFERLILSTNATIIDKKIADDLRQTGALVVTSIDGPAKFHDRFRGQKRAFQKTEKGINRLLDAGVPVKIVMTICAQNYEHIDWCAEWASQLQIETLQFQPLRIIGRAKDMLQDRLSNDQVHALYVHLNDLAVRYRRLGLLIQMAYKRRDFMLAHPCAAFVCNGKKCHRGVDKELKKIVIREDGLILPELVDLDPQFAIGNLYHNSLENNIRDFIGNGYARFDQLCREVYKDTVFGYPSPLIPWDEILTERSHSFAVQSS